MAFPMLLLHPCSLHHPSYASSHSQTGRRHYLRFHATPTHHFQSSRWEIFSTPKISMNTTAGRVTDGHLQQVTEAGEELCEVVSGLELTLGEGDDAFDAYLVKAIKNNNGAAILLLTDVFGFKDNYTRDFAYRLSCFGYNVLVPDLFRGEAWRKERSMQEYENWRAKHPPARVAKDIDTAANWLLDGIAAAGASMRMGLVGFCFGGGRLIETLARDIEGKFAAAVCFYGTRFDPLLSDQISIPVMFICGDNDHLSPLDVVNNVANSIKGSEVRVYRGRGHAFAHRPQSQDDDDDAEDAFNALRSWLYDNLLTKS